MRIGFVVNDVDTEQPQYTTTRLALAATRRGPRRLDDGRRRLRPSGRRIDRRQGAVAVTPQTPLNRRATSARCRAPLEMSTTSRSKSSMSS